MLTNTLLGIVFAYCALPRLRNMNSDVSRDALIADIQCVQRMRAAFAAPAVTVEGLQHSLQIPAATKSREVGLGLRCVELSLRGGLTETSIDVVARCAEPNGDGRVIRLVVTQSAPSRVWPKIASTLASAWNRPTSQSAHGLSWEFTDIERIQELFEGPTSETGVFDIAVPDRLAPEFRLLTSPWERLEVAHTSGIAGTPTRGAMAIRKIVDAGRFDLVRAVLRSCNPEGRVFAASALLARETLDGGDGALIAKLRRDPVEHHVANGCVIRLAQFDAALQALK